MIKKISLAVSIYIIMICSFGLALKAETNMQMQSNKKHYENKTYKVSLKYNKNWKLNPNYIERYEGEDGFFQISAYAGQSLKIEEIVQIEVNHVLKPYGSKPEITKLNIQGQEARLIIPSNDQNSDLNNQAELIVEYPKPIKINENTYYYFILWADKYNIQEIYKTFRFIV